MNILQDTLRPCIHQRAVESAGRIQMRVDSFHSNTQQFNEKTFRVASTVQREDWTFAQNQESNHEMSRK